MNYSVSYSPSWREFVHACAIARDVFDHYMRGRTGYFAPGDARAYVYDILMEHNFGWSDGQALHMSPRLCKMAAYAAYDRWMDANVDKLDSLAFAAGGSFGASPAGDTRVSGTGD